MDDLEHSKFEEAFISSEAFSRLRGNKDQMEFINKKLNKYDVFILIYLRNQPDFLESAYNQSVKKGNETRTVDELLQSGWLSIDYNDEIEQWATVFGHEKIVLRIYDKSSLPNGVVFDVLSILGLGDLQLKSSDKMFKWNIRLPNNMVETKRQINSFLKKPRFVDNFINSWLHLAGMFFKDKELLTERQKQIIYDHNYESNLKLGKKYLGGRFPFAK